MGKREPNIVERAFYGAGYDTFEDFLADHSGDTLVQMAAKLDLNERTFIVYHSRWIDERRQDGEAQPLKLED